MDSSFKQHQNDPAVRAAIQNMRMLSSPTSASAAPAAPAQGGTAARTAAAVPEALTREKLREIMTFHAVTLEKELKPIRDQVEKIRAQGKQPQVSPELVHGVQKRISEAVSAKYGFSDEVIMAAMEQFDAQEAPDFKPILQRIAHSFQSALS